MAYRNLRFAFLHAAADAGDSALTSSSQHADYPRRHLIDRRPSSLFRFNTTTVDEWVKVDRGAGTLEAVDRMIIPPGHNLDTCDLLRIFRSPNDSDWTQVDGWNQTIESDPDGIIDRTFTSTTNRYLRFNCLEAGTQWEFGQLYFTRTRAITVGPEPKWTDQQVPVSVEVPFWTRDATALFAPNRRLYSFAQPGLESTDLTIYDDLIAAVSDAVAFYVDPPDDSETARFVKIVPRSWRREQYHPTPSARGAALYRVSFNMLEQTS
jgi:hypothetical protein